EEEPGKMRVSEARYKEAKETGANTLAVGCPFCMTMLTDASKADSSSSMQVKDVAELVAERMK
ncbi:MAG: (Fe-S)-binding protein, partial [Byssovorax cruenta]